MFVFSSFAQAVLFLIAPLAGYLLGAIVLGFERTRLPKTRRVLAALFVAGAIGASFSTGFAWLGSFVMVFSLSAFMVSLAERDSKSLFALNEDRPSLLAFTPGQPKARLPFVSLNRPTLAAYNPSPKRSAPVRPRLVLIQGGRKDAPRFGQSDVAEHDAWGSSNGSSGFVPAAPLPSQQAMPSRLPRKPRSYLRLAFSNPAPERTARKRNHLHSV